MAHTAIVHKMYHEARDNQVQHYILTTQSFSKFCARYFRDYWIPYEDYIDDHWKTRFMRYCESIHLPCPNPLSYIFIEDTLEDIKSIDVISHMDIRSHVELYYPYPTINLD